MKTSKGKHRATGAHKRSGDRRLVLLDKGPLRRKATAQSRAPIYEQRREPLWLGFAGNCRGRRERPFGDTRGLAGNSV